MKAAPSGILAFKKAAAKGWDDGVPLSELLARVNRVAAKLLPAEEGGDSRVSPTLLPRTFRHYVTLGCIDPGLRVGRRVVYGCRHFVQALLVRRLLADRVPARRMAELVTGGSDEELKRMLFEGIEMVARGVATKRDPEYGPDAVAKWKCVRVAEGIELHMICDLPKPKPAALKKLLGELETALRKNL